jgi:hypothetical protein
VSPEPAVEEDAEKQQIGRQQRVVGGYGFALGKRQQQGGGDKPDCQQQQGIVKQGGETAQKTCGPGWYIGVLHDVEQSATA